uniref:Myb/SANT-like DNA-binding domain-containing protein n=1 Tax=Rhizophora mucronata TaxID=61149 RepID=A0A2P2LR97_RHIMU
MPGDSSALPGPDDVAAAATAATPVHEGGEVGFGVGPGSGEEDKNSSVRIDEGDRTNYGANRWPRKETLALLKIRSDMDAVFRESSHKGPLWEEVSR